jgi:hypothetical protein
MYIQDPLAQLALLDVSCTDECIAPTMNAIVEFYNNSSKLVYVVYGLRFKFDFINYNPCTSNLFDFIKKRPKNL